MERNSVPYAYATLWTTSASLMASMRSCHLCLSVRRPHYGLSLLRLMKSSSSAVFLGTIGVQPMCVAVRSSYAVATGAFSSLNDLRGANLPATDSLRWALMVAACTLSAYSGAMSSVTAITSSFRYCL